MPLLITSLAWSNCLIVFQTLDHSSLTVFTFVLNLPMNPSPTQNDYRSTSHGK